MPGKGLQKSGAATEKALPLLAPGRPLLSSPLTAGPESPCVPGQGGRRWGSRCPGSKPSRAYQREREREPALPIVPRGRRAVSSCFSHSIPVPRTDIKAHGDPGPHLG